jgi:hypothetical protein
MCTFISIIIYLPAFPPRLIEFTTCILLLDKMQISVLLQILTDNTQKQQTGHFLSYLINFQPQLTLLSYAIVKGFPIEEIYLTLLQLIG